MVTTAMGSAHAPITNLHGRRIGSQRPFAVFQEMPTLVVAESTSWRACSGRHKALGLTRISLLKCRE